MVTIDTDVLQVPSATCPRGTAPWFLTTSTVQTLLPLILDLGYCCFNNRASRYQRHTNHKPFLHHHFWQNQSVVRYLTTFIFFHIPLKKHWVPLHVLWRRTSYKELLPQVLDLFSLIILRKPKYIVCYFPRLHLQSNYDLEAQVADYCLPHPCFTMHFVH